MQKKDVDPSEKRAGTSNNENAYSRQISKELRAKQEQERAKIVLWRKPLTTVHYFSMDLLYEIHRVVLATLQHRLKVTVVTLLLVAFLVSYYLEGPHQTYIGSAEKLIIRCSYWIGLGILSSVGLGTGLHTFILYLGPFIASVTLAAFTCDSVDFPQPPYPDDIVCPDEGSPTYAVTFWMVLSKVRLEAFMWGVGTAIGELPPYFMARAARLSGKEEDEEYEELEAALQSQSKDLLTRARRAIYELIQRVGFFGILLCASIPNPLFDLAGITCGHFLVPFWTFFGATVIGKAVIKTHIQTVFVIMAFSAHHFNTAVAMIGAIPYVGGYVQQPFQEYLEKQKQHLHRKPGVTVTHDSSFLQTLFGYVLLAMVVYFVVSIIHSMAQHHAKRLQQQEAVEQKIKSD